MSVSLKILRQNWCKCSSRCLQFMEDYLRYSRSTGVRGKHLHQWHGQEGKGKCPKREHEVVHYVGTRTLKDTRRRNKPKRNLHNAFYLVHRLCSDLSLTQDEFSPCLPLRTLVSLSEGGLVRAPAALLMIKPHCTETHPLLQVIHPVGGDVYHTS